MSKGKKKKNSFFRSFIPFNRITAYRTNPFCHFFNSFRIFGQHCFSCKFISLDFSLVTQQKNILPHFLEQI